MKQSLGPRAFLHPAPVVVVGSYDAAGKPNAMTVSWAGVACSQPPCLAVSIQRSRHTYGGILERRAFTVNLPSQDQVRQVDYLGMVSGAVADKFAVAGLTPVRATTVDAPYVGEFPVVFECRLLHTLDLGAHTQFIGEVLDVKADEGVLGSQGVPDIALVRPLLYAPGQSSYHAVGPCVAVAFTLGKDLDGT